MNFQLTIDINCHPSIKAYFLNFYLSQQREAKSNSLYNSFTNVNMEFAQGLKNSPRMLVNAIEYCYNQSIFLVPCLMKLYLGLKCNNPENNK